MLEACRGDRAEGPLVLRPISGKPIDRRDCYRMVARIAKVAGMPRHISPHSLRHAAITDALDAGVPLRDAQILARHVDPPPPSTDRDRGATGRVCGASGARPGSCTVIGPRGPAPLSPEVSMSAICPVTRYSPTFLVRAAAVGVSAFAAVLLTSSWVAAVEPIPDAPVTSSSGAFDNPYAQPLSALAGETLAQYLVRHHEARLGLR